MRQEQQYPRSISAASLLCLQSAPKFICSHSGWEEILFRPQICDSSRHNTGICCVLAAVPQEDECILKGKNLETRPVQPRFIQEDICPHWSRLRALWSTGGSVSTTERKKPMWPALGQVICTLQNRYHIHQHKILSNGKINSTQGSFVCVFWFCLVLFP